jgi:hypothetical protein
MVEDMDIEGDILDEDIILLLIDIEELVEGERVTLLVIVFDTVCVNVLLTVDVLEEDIDDDTVNVIVKEIDDDTLVDIVVDRDIVGDGIFDGDV